MRLIHLLICLLLAGSVWGQQSARVRELEKQRKETLEEIRKTGELLKQTQATEKDVTRRLKLISQQILSRKKVISLLNQEMEAINIQITDMGKQIRVLENQLQQKKESYGKSVRSMYRRHASQDKLLFILSAESFGQSLRRMRYLREYAQWQKRQATDIISRQSEINRQQLELKKTREEKTRLLASREEEQQKLQVEEKSQKDEIAQLGKKKSLLQAQLKEKQKQANQLNRMIEKQIAEEIAQAERERKAREAAVRKNKKEGTTTTPLEERKADVKGGYAMTKEEKALSNYFSENRGRLPYPVTGNKHIIVGQFGEHQHAALEHVRTNNNGIDILADTGAEARAVFNGVVTRVFTIPGFNNSVIIRHGNYLTVYSNLNRVYVKAGDVAKLPPVRMSFGKDVIDSAQLFCRHNGVKKSLDEKLPKNIAKKFKDSLLIKVNARDLEETKRIVEFMPVPAVIHLSNYLLGGFDKQYPDHLPPRPEQTSKGSCSPVR